MMPRRLQLSRAPGFTLPPGAIRCDRTTIFGNPFKAPDPAVAVEAMRQWLDGEPVQPAPGLELALFPSPDRRRNLLKRLPSLRGHDLACWCDPGAPACHLTLLLARANRGASASTRLGVPAP